MRFPPSDSSKGSADYIAFTNYPNTLNLAPNVKSIEFNWETATLENDPYYYTYRLMGDEADRSSITETNKVEFIGLLAGEYVFEVDVMVGDEIKDTIRYEFMIKPPWWDMIWFKALMVICVIAIPVLFVRFRTQYVRLKSKALKKQVRDSNPGPGHEEQGAVHTKK